MVLILQDPLWRLYDLAFLHTGVARFKVCFFPTFSTVLRDTATTKLCSKFDFSSLVSWQSAHLVSMWQNVSQSIQNTHCKNELELCSVKHFWSTKNSSFLQNVHFSGTSKLFPFSFSKISEFEFVWLNDWCRSRFDQSWKNWQKNIDWSPPRYTSLTSFTKNTFCK